MELEEAIERVAPDMNSQGVANTVWAYGNLGVPPSPQVIDELEAALRAMSETLDALKQVAPGLIRKMSSPLCVALPSTTLVTLRCRRYRLWSWRRQWKG